MRFSRRRVLKMAALAAALPAAAGAAKAEDYPSHPIMIVVPFPAGGPTDILARVLGEFMRGPLGQPFVIENVSGAAGAIGLARVARASPDGYTLSIGHWGTHVAIGATMPLTFDPLNDFEPVSLLADTPVWLVARKDFPAKNTREFIGWLTQNPGKGLAGTVGVGGPSDVNAIYFQNMTKTKFQLVPYRGGTPLNQDLIAGHIDFALGMAASTYPYVHNGLIKAYAIMASSRWWAAPDVPTMDEEGIPGLYASVWHGLWAPKATPKDVIVRLNGAVRLALLDATVQNRYAEQGQAIPPPDEQSPEALGKLQKAEIEKWWPIIKAAGIKTD